MHPKKTRLLWICNFLEKYFASESFFASQKFEKFKKFDPRNPRPENEDMKLKITRFEVWDKTRFFSILVVKYVKYI